MKTKETSCLNRPHSSPQLQSKFQPILVIWEDFAVHGGWHGNDEALEAQDHPLIVFTVGFLLSWNKERLVMAVGYADDGALQEVITVPIGIIKEIQFLGVKKHVPKTLGTIAD